MDTYGHLSELVVCPIQLSKATVLSWYLLTQIASIFLSSVLCCHTRVAHTTGESFVLVESHRILFGSVWGNMCPFGSVKFGHV